MYMMTPGLWVVRNKKRFGKKAATVADVSFAIQDASGLHLKSRLIACVLEQDQWIDLRELNKGHFAGKKCVFFHIFH